MMRCSFCLLISALSIFSGLACLSSNIPVIRSLEPVSNFGFYDETDSTAAVHTLDLDGSLNRIEPDDWKRLSSFQAYRSGKFFDFDPPLYDFYFIVIKNRSAQPINNLSFEEVWQGKITPAINSDDLRKSAIAVSAGIDFGNLFAIRRIITKTISLSGFDADKETLEYPFDFILPGDSIAVIVPFYQIPASERKFSIRLSYGSGGIKKSVAFELRRVEYRQDMPLKK